MSLPRGWKTKVLKGIGAPVTPNNLELLRAWQQAEGGGTANDANFNPLNTTQPMGGAGSINSVGVRSYRSAQQGVQATIKTLLNGHYGAIIENLRGNAHPTVTAAAIAHSPWGTGSNVLKVLGATPVSSLSSASAPDVTAPSTLAKAPSFKSPPSFNPTSLLTENLGKIGQGWSPTALLAETSQGLLENLLQPSKLTTAVRPQVESPLDGGSAPAAPGPGGKWGGSYQPATQLAKLGEGFGLTPTSEKRSTKMTASGNQSDHWTGSKSSYAYDLAGTHDQMNRAAMAIASRLGVKYNGKGPLVMTKTQNGLRYQVLWNTQVGGDHTTHVHLGVRRI